MSNPKMKKFSAVRLGMVGVLGLIVTIVLRWGIISYGLKSEILSKVRLEPGTELWWIWTEVPLPIFSKFYFFNVTNPDEVTKGAKPRLVQMGPYVYQEKRSKIILESGDNSVKYRPRVTYFFRPDLSYGTPDDNITLLNVPYVGIAKIAWDISKEPFVLSTLDDMLTDKGETLFQTNSVREYLFDGVSIENFMELLSLPVANIFGSDIKVPKRLMDGNFGFFDDKNGTAEDIWVVKTGKDSMSNFGRVQSFNGMTKLDGWKTDKCNKIQGTDGSIFPPFADSSRVLEIYSPELCRSVEMTYESPGYFMGLPTLKYTFAKDTFESLKQHPEKGCFCKNSFKWCEKGGVIPIGPCIGGAPVYISQPHFWNSHTDYTDAVIGLSSEGDYKTTLDIEPNIGMPIRASLKMQLNVELEPYSSMPSFATAPNIMFPILWMEETMEVTKELATPLVHLALFLRISDMIAAFFMTCCIVSIVIAFLWEGCSSNWHMKLCK